jgi:hypothetical protein
MIVVATCERGHRWDAERLTQIRQGTPPKIVRVLDPQKCPQCKRESIATYTKDERSAS